MCFIIHVKVLVTTVLYNENIFMQVELRHQKYSLITFIETREPRSQKNVIKGQISDMEQTNATKEHKLTKIIHTYTRRHINNILLKFE